MPDFTGDPWRAETPFHCPYCGYLHDAVSAANGRDGYAPGDGDFSLCFRCGTVARFVVTAFGVSVRKLTDDEIGEIPDDAVKAGFEIRSFWEQHPGKKWKS